MTSRIRNAGLNEFTTNFGRYGLDHLHRIENLLVNLKYQIYRREADVRDHHLVSGTRNVAVHRAVTVTALDAAIG